MPTALDTTENCSTKVSCLRNAGYDTIIRYYSLSSWKRLTPQEANALAKAGFNLCVVYQDRQNQPADFSESQGKSAGRNAFSYAQSVIFQPTGSGIYFAVDYDASVNDLKDRIIPFFRGIQATFQELSAGGPNYRVGVYGSGRTCRMLLEEQLVELTWITQSIGFAEYQKFINSNKWNLRQFLPEKVCGMDLDPNEINQNAGDFGGFLLSSNHFGPALPPSGNDASDRYEVIASQGLRLRAGPSTDFDIRDILPAHHVVRVLSRSGDWALVDATGDGLADGYVHSGYLKATS